MTDVYPLVAFIQDRLDEEERVARAAIEELATDPHINWPENAGQWTANFIYMTDTGFPTDYSIWFDQDSDATVVNVGTHREAVGTHIAFQDPDRVLRAIEAKRRLIAYGGPLCDCDTYDEPPIAPYVHHIGTGCRAVEAARMLASEWPTHEVDQTNREKWKP